MRDSAIIEMVNQGVNRLAQATSLTFHKMAREIDELRGHLTAETIRRQVLEEILFTPDTFKNGISKDGYEAAYQKAIEDYNQKVKEEMDKAEALQKEAMEKATANIAVPPKKTLVGPDGVTPL